MTNEEIRSFLTEHAEGKFKEFTAGLIPGTDPIIGVRLPVLRELAKQLAKEDWRSYLAGASDETYEEIMLQGLVIGYARAPIEELLSYAKAFIPKIHDWSVNDGFCSTFKIARKYRETVWEFLMQYRESENEFEQRVVAVMLMDHFLVEDYIDRVLAVWDSLKHEGYYCKMGVAWGIATAYAKFPEKTHAFLCDNHLDDFTYNKSIQKMLESYRVSDADKEILRGMKRKNG
ncbi:MAG: DNA alkylation repair protein [Roseburia sp.]|nr:DNA alkylation repair protein [Roseburia sp.]